MKQRHINNAVLALARASLFTVFFIGLFIIIDLIKGNIFLGIIYIATMLAVLGSIVYSLIEFIGEAASAVKK